MSQKGVYQVNTVFSGATTSSPVETAGWALVGVICPASMAGAILQVEAANEGDDNVRSAFVPVFDSLNNRIQVTNSSAAGYRLFSQNALIFGADWVRLVSPSNETSTCTLVFQEVA
jgi:hypothetical protein